MSQRVLVVGGSYFIGKKIVDILMIQGYDVTVLNRGTRILDNVKQITCDRNNKEGMVQCLKNKIYDYIVDVSGLNKEQAGIICKAIDMSDLKKFIFLSSSAVYDIDHLQTPFREEDIRSENRYWTLYGKDKIEAEDYYATFFRDTKVKLIILRPPYVYGENNYAQRESFIFEHIEKNLPILIPKSNPVLQFIYTTDLANIVDVLLKKEEKSLSIYNVGNREPVSSNDWIHACEKVAGRQTNVIYYDYQEDRRQVRDFFPFHDYNNILDVTKIHAVIDQETPFHKGLKAAYKWYIKEREHIVFKKNVSDNERRILEQLQLRR